HTETLCENLTPQYHYRDRCPHSCQGHPSFIVQPILFSKKRARPQNSLDLSPRIFVRVPDDFYFAALDDIKIPRRLTLFHDEITRFIMSMPHSIGRTRSEVSQISREKQQPCPIKTDLHPACPRRQLEQINSAPNEPG